jgi:hypothetical protein
MLVLVCDRGDLELATSPHTAESLFFHEPAHRAVGDGDPFAVQLLPDLLGAVGAVVVGAVHARDLNLQGLVAHVTW